MKRILSILLTFLMLISVSTFKYARADVSSIRVTKAYYINNGKDLSIKVAIKNTSSSILGGIYQVKIILLDKNGTLIVNNTFKDTLLRDKIIQPNKELNWEFIFPNAKKGDLSKMSTQAFLSWSGQYIKGGANNAPKDNKGKNEKKQQLKITKVEYLENNTKIRLYGMFVNESAKKYSKIAHVKIKILDSDGNVIANAEFNDDKLSDCIVLPNSQLNWKFIINNPKVGDITNFKAETSFTYK